MLQVREAGSSGLAELSALEHRLLHYGRSGVEGLTEAWRSGALSLADLPHSSVQVQCWPPQCLSALSGARSWWALTPSAMRPAQSLAGITGAAWPAKRWCELPQKQMMRLIMPAVRALLNLQPSVGTLTVYRLPVLFWREPISLVLCRPIYVFTCGAMVCLLTSSVCHTLGCCARHISLIVWRFDYVGIAVLIVASFYPPVSPQCTISTEGSA